MALLAAISSNSASSRRRKKSWVVLPDRVSIRAEPTCTPPKRSPNRRRIGSDVKRQCPDRWADGGETDGVHRLVPQPTSRSTSWPTSSRKKPATAATAAGKAGNRAGVVVVAAEVGGRSRWLRNRDDTGALGDPPADICSYGTLYC